MQKWNLIYMESRKSQKKRRNDFELDSRVTMRKLRKLKDGRKEKKRDFPADVEGVRKCQTFLTSLCISASKR